MKAHYLLKHNIDTLLKARGQKRRELAGWCRRSESWLSQIFIDEERNIPLKYLDRIADFFGVTTYQLFQPGISPLTERRKGGDRRGGIDRRISARNRELPVTPRRQIEMSPEDEAMLGELRQLTHDEYQRIRHHAQIMRLGRSTEPSLGVHGDQPQKAVAQAVTAPSTRAPRQTKQEPTKKRRGA